MNRRKFIAAFSKVSLVTAAASATTVAASRGREKAEVVGEGLSQRMEELKKRVDALEEDQKDYLRALCLVTAVSTGLDLSFLI